MPKFNGIFLVRIRSPYFDFRRNIRTSFLCICMCFHRPSSSYDLSNADCFSRTDENSVHLDSPSRPSPSETPPRKKWHPSLPRLPVWSTVSIPKNCVTSRNRSPPEKVHPQQCHRFGQDNITLTPFAGEESRTRYIINIQTPFQ